MERWTFGVPKLGTPIFLSGLIICLFLSAQALASQALPINSPATTLAGNSLTAQNRVVLFADELCYFESTGYISARGHVRLWYANITLTAEFAEADLETEIVHAQDNVVLVESERMIQCASLDYHLRDQSAQAQGILFATYPWYYQGEAVEKQGDKRVIITRPLFTTCNARHPHYHIQAERIEIILGETLTAYQAVLYVGTTPLFYWPWLQRSIKDSRPPFSIRVGYNDYEGFYVRVKVNYFLAEDNYGAVLLNLMERKGLGLGLDHHLAYKLWGKGQADLSGLMVRDEKEGKQRWTGKLTEQHDINQQDMLQLNLDYLSDQEFNRQFDSQLVDNYQQKSYLSYSHRDDMYYLGVEVQDVETWDPWLKKYQPTLRELPSIDFSRSSQILMTLWQPMYFSFSSSFIRGYQNIEDIWYTWLGETPSALYRFEDQLNLIPRFTQTYTAPLWFLTQPSLSLSLSLPINLTYQERYFPQASGEVDYRTDWNTAYTTNVTLSNKWVNYQRTRPTHLLQSRLTHEFTRKFSVLQTQILSRAGVAAHRLRLEMDYDMGTYLHMGGRTAYNLLSEEEEWRQHLEALSFDGRAAIESWLSLDWQGIYHWLKERITSGNVALNTQGSAWNLSLNTSYSYRENYSLPHAVFSNLNAAVAPPGLGLTLHSSVQYDFTEQNFTYFTVGISRDLHCWAVQAGYKVYADGVAEIGAGIQLKAFPEIQAGMGGEEQGLAIGGE